MGDEEVEELAVRVDEVYTELSQQIRALHNRQGDLEQQVAELLRGQQVQESKSVKTLPPSGDKVQVIDSEESPRPGDDKVADKQMGSETRKLEEALANLDEDRERRQDPRNASKGISNEGVSCKFLSDETQERYVFGYSTWDVVVFIGTGTLGFGASVLTVLLIFTKVAMQVTFLGIVYLNFTEPAVSQETVEGARTWRTRIAHSYDHMDSLSEMSLTARVCEGDLSLETSASQALLSANLRTYLLPENTGISSLFNGVSMCLVALLCWYLMVSKELQESLNLFRALGKLPRTPKSKIVADKRRKGTYRLESISYIKVVLAVVVLCYRLAIACLLVYNGTIFLVYTVEITELILNAVALEIILSIDELIFEALATSSTRHLLMKLQPIEMPRWPHRDGVDLKALLAIILLPVALVCVYLKMLAPMVQDLESVLHALCGGNRDFVWQVNALDMVVMAPSVPYGSYHFDSSVQSDAIDQAIFGDATKGRLWLSGPKELHEKANAEFQDVLDALQPECTDVLDDEEGIFLKYLQSVVKDDSITSCNDAKQWCSSVSILPDWNPDGGKGLMTRALCPQTCSCFDVRSPIFVATGCPKDCTTAVNSLHRTSLQQGNCGDLSDEELRRSPFWASWLDQLRIYAVEEAPSLGPYYGPRLASAPGKLWDKGCGALSNWTDADPCGKWNGLPFKSLANVCPSSCGCPAGKVSGGCPASCDSCTFSQCSDMGNDCVAGSSEEACSCYRGAAHIVEEVPFQGMTFYRYACCEDGSGFKDTCGAFEYCDICRGAGVDHSAVYDEGEGKEPIKCSDLQKHCSIPHHCQMDSCGEIQHFFTTGTECCLK